MTFTTPGGHEWADDEDGEMDTTAWDGGPHYCHGPACQSCHATPCVNCQEDEGWELELCPNVIAGEVSSERGR